MTIRLSLKNSSCPEWYPISKINGYQVKNPRGSVPPKQMPAWFKQSWAAMQQDQSIPDSRWENATALYEDYFGVKVVMHKTLSYEFLSAVEFPSEDAAVLFMLRWS